MPRTIHKLVLSALCAAVGATLVACGSSAASTPQALTSGETPSAPVTLPSTVPTARSDIATPDIATPAQSVTLDSTAWLAGFEVRVTGVDVDPSSQTVGVSALLTNTSQIDASLTAVTGEISLDPGDESGLIPVQQVRPSANVVAGTSARTTIVFPASAPIPLTTAALVLGTAAHHQWRVPLQAGAAATRESPVSVNVGDRDPG